MPYKSKKLKAIKTDSLDSLGDSVVDLAKWTEDEFAQLATDLQSTEADTIWPRVPPKPRRGTIAIADGTNWNPGYGEGSYYFNGTVWLPTNVLAVTKQSWRLISGTGDPLVPADHGRQVEFNNASNFSMTTSTMAALGNGWYCDVFNANNGIITLTPGSGGVDGQSTMVIWPWERMRLTTDGSNLWSCYHSNHTWINYNPTVSASGGGTAGSTSTFGRYKKIRDKMFIQLSLSIPAMGTLATYVQASLPMAGGPNATTQMLCGEELSINGKTLNGFISATSSVIQIRYYDNSATAGAANNGVGYTLSGHYEVGL